MNETNRERVEEFLDQLEEALPEPGHRKREILLEVESDLMASIDAGIESGHSENDSVNAALKEMGNPYEVAHKISQVVAPVSHTPIAIIRYFASAGVMLWTLYLCWNFRAWFYGPEAPAVLAVILLFHVPLIALVWPGIVWRKNWLFGLIPAGLAIVIAVAASVTGISASGERMVPIDPQELAAMEAAPRSSDDLAPTWERLLLFAGTLAAFAVILFAIQRTRQRHLVFGATLLVFLLVELTYQWEELRFRQDWKEISQFVEDYRKKDGAFPGKQALVTTGPALHNESFLFSSGESGYQLFWDRPLNRGFALVADSRKDSIRVQD